MSLALVCLLILAIIAALPVAGLLGWLLARFTRGY